MNYTTSAPVLYTKNDLQGHRVRFLVAEKRAAIETRIMGPQDIPPFMDDINPRGIYPFLADKNIVCHGAPLDELLNERYPAPALIPSYPLQRARDRMLAAEVIQWYHLGPEQIRQKLDELDGIIDPSNRFLLGYLSIVDIALAPILYKATLSKKLGAYAKELFSRPSFEISLRDSAPSFTDAFLAEAAVA